jgi:hypothetical protein
MPWYGIGSLITGKSWNKKEKEEGKEEESDKKK